MEVVIIMENIRYYKASGCSMEPTIVEGDELLVANLPPAQYRIGNIVLYQRPDANILVAHRLVKILPGSGHFLLRSDAEPDRLEQVDATAIVGRIEAVKRGVSLTFLPSSAGLWNRLKIHFYPAYVACRHQIAIGFSFFLEAFQNWKGYQTWALQHLRPEIRATEVEKDFYRVVATVENRFAGRLDLEILEGLSEKGGWISSLYVRLRYRRARIAQGLIQEAIRLVASREVPLVWVSFEQGNSKAGRLYEKMGFRRAADSEWQQWKRKDRLVEKQNLYKLSLAEKFGRQSVGTGVKTLETGAEKAGPIEP